MLIDKKVGRLGVNDVQKGSEDDELKHFSVDGSFSADSGAARSELNCFQEEQRGASGLRVFMGLTLLLLGGRGNCSWRCRNNSEAGM